MVSTQATNSDNSISTHYFDLTYQGKLTRVIVTEFINMVCSDSDYNSLYLCCTYLWDLTYFNVLVFLGRVQILDKM